MLDYHLHLWPHGQQAAPLSVEQIAAYCDRAAAAGVTEIALTEHLFRFRQADALLRGYWEADPDPALRAHAQRYWDAHATADLEDYVARVLEAENAGLPVVLGLEVDLYAGNMDAVGGLLAGWPFDVLLGSVHWLGAWLFDSLGTPEVMAQWEARDVDQVWDAYCDAMDELAGSGACDVLAHPDLAKIAGKRPAVPDGWYDRLVDAAVRGGVAAELSSAGLRKPIEELYPAAPLLARFQAAGVAVTTASDAHELTFVADHGAELRAALAASGYRELTAFRDRKPHAVAIAPAPSPAAVEQR